MSQPVPSQPIGVLLVEDNPGDARLIVEMLREVGPEIFRVERAGRLQDAVKRLEQPGIDAILLDLGLPDSEGIETFRRAEPGARGLPIVVISGLDDEHVALEAVRSGAQDYLVKGQIDGHLLARVIRYAIERLERDERFQQVTETIREVFFLVDADFRETLYVSPGYEEIWGRSRKSLYESPQSFMDAVLPEDRPGLIARIQGLQAGGDPDQQEFRIDHPREGVRWILVNSRGIRDSTGRVYRIAGVGLDVTQRKQVNEALRASEQRLRTLFETVNLIVLGLGSDGRVQYANPFLVQTLGYPEEEIVGADWCARFLPPLEVDAMSTVFRELLGEGLHAHRRNAIRTRGGEERMISWHNTVLRDAQDHPIGTLSVGEDVTEQVGLEEQLRRAQKMEAVGRLAGGIAHDFNNLLTAILGPAEMLLMELKSGDPAREDIEEIKAAAERAATLTRQLLAFSRQQVLEPRQIDLNEVVKNLDRMLGRIIGEDIEFRTILGKDLGTVRADPGQVEQVIMNLVVNSRDAMPTGGTLTIETANTELDEHYADRHFPVSAGDYVMLAVSDTGVGMDAATRAKVFEPFFTTKPKGKGTGLGLATAYGIVKQSGGYIWAYSEVGQGTTFKVYLPRVDQPSTAALPDGHEQRPLHGSETILVVEDEKIVQAVTRRMLEARGYTVLIADSGREALETVEKHSSPIRLLVTDVVMPEMNGRELARLVQKARPEMRVIYVSGYTDDMIVHHGVLEPGVQFLQKPFTPDALARKVRQVLDS